MECYERTKINMTIKTFRGKISDDTIDTIVLHTNNGTTGYRITKLKLMGITPGSDSVEHVVKVYSVPQTTADANIDFSDQTLLGAIFLTQSSSAGYAYEVVTFDNMIFNQDIYVTHEDNGPSNKAVNYYIELEQVKLDLSENTVATLKDIRNVTAPT